MAIRFSRRLVIDASLASAAGGNGSRSGTAGKCLSVLLAIRSGGHRVVMTAQIRAEWDAEKSRRAAKWLYWMESKRQTLWLTPEQTAEVRIDLTRAQATPYQTARMQEDLHLVEAAICTDRILFSLDDEARCLFAAACVALPGLGAVMWANPKEEANPAVWIEKGAPTQESRMLRNYAPDAL